jgi:hypothetical protein
MLVFVLSPTATAGASVTLGPFRYSLLYVDDNQGFADIHGQPQGQYLNIGIAVTNIGSQPQYFQPDRQTLTDEAGRTFALDKFDSFTKSPYVVNPGNVIKGLLLFDVPSSSPTSDYDLVLRSPGVTETAVISLNNCGDENPCHPTG